MLAAVALALVPATSARGFVALPHTATPVRYVARAAVRMESTKKSPKEGNLYEEYIRKRTESGEDVDTFYSDLGADIDFDGGDSGSGAVGDGKVTLDDQHNSPYIVGGGSLRDAVEGAQNAAAGSLGSSGAKKRSKVSKTRKVEAAVDARDVKQKNYWGRSVGTGYADSLSEDRKYKDRPVLRQQLENWQNQQNLKAATDQAVASMSNFYGQEQMDQATLYRKTKGRPIDTIRSAISVDNVQSTARLDGEEWGDVVVEDDAEYDGEYELMGRPNSPGVLDVQVLNEYSHFAPYRVAFTRDSPEQMSVTPTEGVMEKRDSGITTDLVIRFQPSEYGIPVIGKLVFETEDFKKVFKIVGKTAR